MKILANAVFFKTLQAAWVTKSVTHLRLTWLHQVAEKSANAENLLQNRVPRSQIDLELESRYNMDAKAPPWPRDDRGHGLPGRGVAGHDVSLDADHEALRN